MQHGVGRHLVAGGEYYDIAHHDVLLRYACRTAVAYHRHRFVVAHLVEDLKLPFGLDLGKE